MFCEGERSGYNLYQVICTRLYFMIPKFLSQSRSLYISSNFIERNVGQDQDDKENQKITVYLKSITCSDKVREMY